MEQLEYIFNNRPEITAAYLFGSRAKGTAGPGSDVDIALLLSEKPDRPAMAEVDYSLAVEKEAGLKKVDVKILNGSPLYFQYEVLKTGKVIFCRDQIRRVRYEAHLMMEYFDFKPYLDYYNRRMHEHIKEGSYGPGLSVDK